MNRIMDKKVYIDLSSKALNHLPLIELNNLQYLYLDNNRLTELPTYLFFDAPNLKWLDIRDNLIEKIPDSIKNHACLETMLMQNNKISYLPNFLSTVERLQCIQLSGNPLIYPKKSIVASGTEFLMKYLKFEYEKETGDKRSGDYIDILVTPCESQEYSTEKDESDDTDSVKGKDFESDKSSLLPQNERKCVARFTIDPREHDRKVKESLIVDIWKEKRREMLSKREKILQDRRNLEVLKNWRCKYRESQTNNNRIYVLNLSTIPYDTDLKYAKILTRADIEKDLPDKYKKNIRCKSGTVFKNRYEKMSFQKKIDDIIECMQSIKAENGSWSPRTAKEMISHEIKKLSDLKSNISKLKMDNDRY